MTQDAENSESRAGRARVRRARRAGVLVRVALFGGGAAILVVGWLVGTHVMAGRGASATPPLASVATSVATAPVSVATGQVEVPDFTGMALVQARAVAAAAGLSVHVSIETSLPADPGQAVHTQTPVAGEVVSVGALLTLTVGRSPSGGPAKARAGRQFVVVIDPGHQSHADPALEPIGPGSKQTQAKATAGSTGVVTGIPEYEIVLQIATNLQDRLQASGIKVVMTRTTNDVDISNATRAQIANAAKADLFLRIHADSSADSSRTGISTAFPASNPWTKPIAGRSSKAAAVIQADAVSATGAVDNGAVARSDIAGFNWAKVPSVLVDCGYQSNPVEDRLLSSSRYQDQLAGGIAQGVVAYLSAAR